MNIIIIITRFSCLEARCVCRQAAVKAAEILSIVGLARSKQAVGTLLSIYTAPRQPEPYEHIMIGSHELGSTSLVAPEVTCM
jgi:hypothetical protein